MQGFYIHSTWYLLFRPNGNAACSAVQGWLKTRVLLASYFTRKAKCQARMIPFMRVLIIVCICARKGFGEPTYQLWPISLTHIQVPQVDRSIFLPQYLYAVFLLELPATRSLPGPVPHLAGRELRGWRACRRDALETRPAAAPATALRLCRMQEAEVEAKAAAETLRGGPRTLAPISSPPRPSPPHSVPHRARGAPHTPSGPRPARGRRRRRRRRRAR